MIIKRVIRGIIGLFRKAENWSQQNEEKIYTVEETAPISQFDEIHSVWDYLKFKPNTQAFHLSSALGFDEWVDMNEIRRRIKELFGAEYKNERSLYPYLKTLTDIGLMENNSIGGRMQWRKHDLIIKIEKKNGEKKIVIAETKQVKKEKNREEET